MIDDNDSALYLNNSNYIYTEHSNSELLSLGDFTIETWVKFLGINDQNSIFDAYRNWNSNYNSFSVGSRNGVIGIWATTYDSKSWDVANYLTFSSKVSTNVWYHVAVVRDSTSIKCFFNGNLNATISIDKSIELGHATNYFRIGAAKVNNSTSIYFNGLIDEFKIIKGVALYSDNFTPSNPHSS